MHSIGSVLFLVAAVQAVLRNVFCLESAELKQRVKDDIRHPGGLFRSGCLSDAGKRQLTWRTGFVLSFLFLTSMCRLSLYLSGCAVQSP